MAQAEHLTFEVINTESFPNDYLQKINRPEMGLLLYMLDELAIKREDLEKLTQPYLDSLPPLQREIVMALKIMANPANPPVQPDMIAALSLGITSPNEQQQARARSEFVRIATELHNKGSADHEFLGQSKNDYGDDAKLSAYKAPGGKLDHRMKNDGYTFFTLRDKNGTLVALASGNATKLAASSSYLTDQLRLLNIAVSPEYRGEHYGEQLIGCISQYAAENKYEKIVMPLSINALVKGNPAIYKAAAEKLEMDAPVIQPHASDPLSLEFSLPPKIFLAKREEQRRAQVTAGGYTMAV